jgi:membrane-associated phospholipid phosphatase
MKLFWPSEIPIILFLQNLGAWLGPIMRTISLLGTEDFFLLIMPVIFWSLDSALGIRLGYLILSSSSVNGWIKLVFQGSRPYWFDARVKGLANESSFGFPSGHTQSATVIWGRLAAWTKRSWFWAVACIIILLVGLSRIFLGVHFISDVIGGLIIGILFLILFLLLEKPIAKWWSGRRLGWQIIFGFLSSLVFILIEWLITRSLHSWQLPAEWLVNATRDYPLAPPNPIDISGAFTVAGTWFGLTAGISWIMHRGGFTVAKEPAFKVFSFLVGLIGVLAIRMGLDLVFPDSVNWIGFGFRYLRYTLVGFWVAGLAPFIFISLKWASKSNQ